MWEDVDGGVRFIGEVEQNYSNFSSIYDNLIDVLCVLVNDRDLFK